MLVKCKVKTKRLSPEHDLQSTYFQWLELAHPKEREVIFSIPNGVFCSKLQKFKLKKEGLTLSVPDIFISIPRQGFHGYYIEFKAAGKKATEEQLIKHELLRAQGYKVDVIDNIDVAVKETTIYLYT